MRAIDGGGGGIDEAVVRGVGVVGDQVGGTRGEAHVATVAAEDRVNSDDGVVGLSPVIGHVHPSGRSVDAVADKDVPVVDRCVDRDEIIGRGDEGHEAAVGADRGHEAAPVALGFVICDADPVIRAGRTVIDERVGEAVGVTGNDIWHSG